jgi:hypothetical protein
VCRELIAAIEDALLTTTHCLQKNRSVPNFMGGTQDLSTLVDTTHHIYTHTFERTCEWPEKCAPDVGSKHFLKRWKEVFAMQSHHDAAGQQWQRRAGRALLELRREQGYLMESVDTWCTTLLAHRFC